MLDKAACSPHFRTMRYISPKTDFAFKKIFGSPGSQGILRSFLNGILYEGQARIASLEIVDPYSIPRLQGMKDSYLDVRAVLDDGQRVIIEMQVLNIPGMEKRVLYNAAKEYSNQLARGQDYQLLNPVIALTITDFIMFPELEEQVISRFALMEKNKLIAYPDGDVELVFVELPKFKRGLDELHGLTDEWLFFVDSAADMNQVPTQLSAVTEIEDAFEIAETARLTPEEDHRLELKTRWIADQKMILEMKLNAEASAAAAISLAEQAKQHAIEETERAEQEAARAEQEAARAEQEAARAEQEAARAKEADQRADQEASKSRAALKLAVSTLAEVGLDHATIAVKLAIPEALVSELLA
jgi:predicted transposase/invertase (TIGR01784 family)